MAPNAENDFGFIRNGFQLKINTMGLANIDGIKILANLDECKSTSTQ